MGNEVLSVETGEACALLDDATSSYSSMAVKDASEAQMNVLYRQEGLERIA